MAKRILSIFALVLVLISGQTLAQTSTPANDFTDKQKEQIEAVVRNLLVNKDPMIILNAAHEAQRKQEEEAGKKAVESVGKNKDKLFSNAKDPFVGNEKGDVVVVEFFDYNCGYCKKANPTIRKLIEEDKNVKVIYKEFPILAESSRLASRYALAANKQNKYAAFHNALMESKAQINDDKLMEIAGQVGLDKDKLKKDMEDPDVNAQITADQDLGRDVGARGTPTFIVGDKVVPGAMELEEMKSIIAEMRKGKKS